MSDMDHMDHLEQLAAADVLALRQKERTYQGSWKASGGRSAWFMLRRKMDRLISMLRRPDPPAGFDLRIAALGINAAVRGMKLSEGQVEALAHITDAYCAEDIFQLITNDGGTGLDGTVLAEVRDLRRYLLLVEAEMVARGVVVRSGENPLGPPLGSALDAPSEGPPGWRMPAEWKAPAPDLQQKMTDAMDVERETAKAAALATAFLAERPAPGVARGEEPRPAPAADGERLVPRYAAPAAAPAFGVSEASETITWEKNVSIPQRPGTPENGGHHSRYRWEDGQTTNPGEPYFHVVDPVSREIYWNVWRPDCERVQVEHLPQLRMELNNHEWKELVPEYRGMYDWFEGEAKWRVKGPYQEAWCEDSGRD